MDKTSIGPRDIFSAYILVIRDIKSNIDRWLETEFITHDDVKSLYKKTVTDLTKYLSKQDVYKPVLVSLDEMIDETIENDEKGEDTEYYNDSRFSDLFDLLETDAKNTFDTIMEEISQKQQEKQPVQEPVQEQEQYVDQAIKEESKWQFQEKKDRDDCLKKLETQLKEMMLARNAKGQGQIPRIYNPRSAGVRQIRAFQTKMDNKLTEENFSKDKSSLLKKDGKTYKRRS